MPVDEVIGAGERNEALGMLRRQEDMTGVLNPDRIVGRRMEDKQRLAQAGDARFKVLVGDVIEERAADMELPAAERDLDFVLIAARGFPVGEQAGDVPGIGRGIDRHHRARFGDAMGGGEHSGSAEAVADQNRGRGKSLAQMVGGGDQIVDVRGERGVGKLALAAAEPGEIETQHGDSVLLQTVGDAPCGPVVLATGEAVCKQRDRARRRLRAVEQRSELQALGIVEVEPLGRHPCLLDRIGHRVL